MASPGSQNGPGWMMTMSRRNEERCYIAYNGSRSCLVEMDVFIAENCGVGLWE
jgi:hypothetical protein